MHPSYLDLPRGILEERASKLWKVLGSCTLCPHKCKVDRLKGEKGFCRLGPMPLVSSAEPHFGEEAPISGWKGSGTIFFTGCNLACVFCQNFELSQLRMGSKVSFEGLADMMVSLQDLGCHNINLVTPTPQVASIVKALPIAIGRGLKVPIVYNTGGYDSVEALRLLRGVVDVYMPDVKYGDDRVAGKYSLVRDYYARAKEAVKEMHRQVGDLVSDEKGVAVKGLLVRHLVLPVGLAGSAEVFRFLAEEVSKNTFVNVMGQYHPCYKADEYPELSRRASCEEVKEAVELARKAGLKRIIT